MLSINLDGLEDDVRPLLQKTMTYLKNAQDILYSMAIPSDFSYNSTLRNMPGEVSYVYENVKGEEKWISEVISNFSSAESSNSSLIDSIANLLKDLEISQDNNIEGGVKENSNPGIRCRKQLTIKAICVDENNRRKGIGKLLLEHVKNIAQDNHCTDMNLTVNQENTNAIKLYEEFGFKLK